MADLTEQDTGLEERDDADAGEAAATDLDAVHQRALARFDAVSTAQAEVRANSLAARRFVTIPGAQWDDQWGESFPDAVKLEVNKTGRGVEKIERDYRENRIVPDFRPDGKNADPDTADALDGLHRADNYRFKSQQARDNGAFEAIAGGFGAYRLTTEWDDEYDKDNDYLRRADHRCRPVRVL
jgi:Phage P22-like portal protein